MWSDRPVWLLRFQMKSRKILLKLCYCSLARSETQSLMPDMQINGHHRCAGFLLVSHHKTELQIWLEMWNLWSLKIQNVLLHLSAHFIISLPGRGRVRKKKKETIYLRVSQDGDRFKFIMQIYCLFQARLSIWLWNEKPGATDPDTSAPFFGRLTTPSEVFTLTL